MYAKNIKLVMPKKFNSYWYKWLHKPKKQLHEYDKRQMRIGLAVELEHTKNPNIAVLIAAHHLDEYPDYYDRLLEMESKAEKYWDIED